jgi:hypothetical protein
MRYIFVTPAGIVDSFTGECLDLTSLESLLLCKPGGVIAGNNLYPVLARLVPMIKSDHGWSARLKLQQKKKYKTQRMGGAIYFTNLIYRFPKVRSKGKRFRPGSIKWVVLNLELFTETEDIESAARALVGLAERRGIKPRHSPGAFGGGLLRASPQWEKGRNPAPWFISDKARQYLPGNYYAIRAGVQMVTIPRSYYLDQRSSHHSIASSISLPHPRFLRARGRLRAVERGRYPIWLPDPSIISNHVGLLCVVVECDYIPLKYEHLYPPWARKKGKHVTWIWTPELRLLDRRVRLRWISAALTSIHADPALLEFAEWALVQLRDHKHTAIKPALLAAYGLLGARTSRDIDRYSVSGRPKSPRAETCTLPLIGDCYRSNVSNVRVPVTQNVVARGVIESETRTRSIEYARRLEWEEGVRVNHIYADGLIVEADQMPFLPEGWRIAGELTDVRSSSPNTIHSNEMTRTPGIPSGRRSVNIEPVQDSMQPLDIPW